MEALSIQQEVHAIPIWDLKIGDAEIYNFTTIADTIVQVTVPANANKAIIFGDDHFFVGEATGILPANAVPTLSTLVEDLTQVKCTGVTTLFFRTRNVTDMSVAFYK